MTIYLTRHGRSLTNAGLYPHADNANRYGVLSNDNIVLLPEGIRQANAYGRKCRARNISEIVTSPFARTKQTAYCIASSIATMVPITLDESIRELEWHPEIQTAEYLTAIGDENEKKHHIDKTLTSFNTMMCSRETQREVFNRTIPALVRLCEQSIKDQRNIVAVSHFFPLRAAWAVVKGNGPESMPEFSPKNLHDMKISPEEFIDKATKYLP